MGGDDVKGQYCVPATSDPACPHPELPLWDFLLTVSVFCCSSFATVNPKYSAHVHSVQSLIVANICINLVIISNIYSFIDTQYNFPNMDFRMAVELLYGIYGLL